MPVHMALRRGGHRTRTYQFSLLTSRPPEDVLQEVGDRRLAGIGVAERGSSYLILRPEQRRRYGADLALLLGVAIVLGVLILTAVSPVFVVLLLLAPLPALPALLDHRPDLAVSAVPELPGATRVTVHGLASAELAAAMDAYLGSLPRWTPPAVAAAQTPALTTRAAG